MAVRVCVVLPAEYGACLSPHNLSSRHRIQDEDGDDPPRDWDEGDDDGGSVDDDGSPDRRALSPEYDDDGSTAGGGGGEKMPDVDEEPSSEEEAPDFSGDARCRDSVHLMLTFQNCRGDSSHRGNATQGAGNARTPHRP